MSDGLKRVSHCSHWGAYSILVRDGRIEGIEPFSEDPDPSPLIHSVKGWADPAKRVLKPLVREEWLRRRERAGGSGRGTDSYVEVSWDTALDLVAAEITRVRVQHGNRSIFAGSYGWTSCGRFHHAASQLKRMLNLSGGYTGHADTYSIAAGPVILREVLGSDALCKGAATSLDVVADHTETIVIFGALSPRTAQSEAGGLGRHMLETRLRRMRERRVRFILISPVRDDLPEWIDAEWLPLRPNTDVALMLALARELVLSGNHDVSFLAKYCSGSRELLDYLAGKSDGVEKNARWAENITGLSAESIRQLASVLTKSRTMITVSWSLQRAHHGEQPYWAGLALACFIGQIGLPGGGVGFGYGSLGGVGEPQSSVKSPALPQGDNPAKSFIPCARISDLLLGPGTPFDYEGKTYTYPDIRMIYWAGGNPFHHHQDINRLRRAWERPETIVVQDPLWTATAARADIVLPATTSLERNDLAGNAKTDYLIAMHKAIEPVGLSRTDYDIQRALAERLGIEERFSEGRDEMDWLRYLYGLTRTDAAERLGSELPDFDEFWNVGWARVPSKTSYVVYKEFREDPDASPLPTESGRILLTSKHLQSLDYSDCPGHPAWIEPAEWLSKVDYLGGEVFHLISRQPEGRLHSQLHSEKSSLKDKKAGREQVMLNPAAAERLNVVDGDTVRLFNRRGQCLATASVTATVRDNVLILPTGGWYSPSDGGENALELAGNPNVLTLDLGTSSFGQGCSAHTCIVQIEKISQPNSLFQELCGAPPAEIIKNDQCFQEMVSAKHN